MLENDDLKLFAYSKILVALLLNHNAVFSNLYFVIACSDYLTNQQKGLSCSHIKLKTLHDEPLPSQ